MEHRRFKHADLVPLIEALPDEFTVDTAGLSVEDRVVYRLQWGATAEDAVEVLLWSQMHGDEPTATAALFDLFNWLSGTGDGLDSLRSLIADRLRLTFLPMLNPDGAERYTRRNALGIDLNRDARHLTSPESRILKDERDRLDADWGFNLHDQSPYYSAGFPAGRGCVLSILAPAYDWEKTMNAKRGDAARLIALMNGYWQREVPGQVGRYNDDYEPRAFGDNLQAWGTRTILIESGGFPGDPEKQAIRRLNLLGLIVGLASIANGDYAGKTLDAYWAIPENQSNGMHELIIRDATISSPDGKYTLDIGLRMSERTVGESMRQRHRSAYVSDLGDLHTFGAFATVDADSATVKVGKVYPSPVTIGEAKKLDEGRLFREGYTAVRLSSGKAADIADGVNLRVLAEGERYDKEITYGATVDLLIYRNGALTDAVVNGRHFPVE